MTVHHHPSDELLLDYASGALAEAWSLAVATHLALCPTCRRTVEMLEAVGGEILEKVAPEPVAESSFKAVMARLQDSASAPTEAALPKRARDGAFVLPQPLRDYVGGDLDDLHWQRLGLGAYQRLISTGGNGATARLLRIPAGKPVPTHGHCGKELTLVLCGTFTDTTGTYGRGDLQEADTELEHQPLAAPKEDCICLAVTDAPLRFRSLVARLVQPLLNI